MNALTGRASGYNDDEKQLIASLHAGEEKALRALYEAHARTLCLYAYQITKDFPQSEDIVNDAFMELWNQRAAFTSVAGIRAFLNKVARNSSLNYLKFRKVRRLKEPEVIQQLLGRERELFNKEQLTEILALLTNAIQQLPETQRRILEATIWEDKSAQETAQLLNLSVPTVKINKHRAIVYLRAYAVLHKIVPYAALPLLVRVLLWICSCKV